MTDKERALAHETACTILSKKLVSETTTFSSQISEEGILISLQLEGMGETTLLLEYLYLTYSQEIAEYFISAQLWNAIEKLAGKYIRE
jgi:hypothetical protein